MGESMEGNNPYELVAQMTQDDLEAIKQIESADKLKSFLSSKGLLNEAKTANIELDMSDLALDIYKFALLNFPFAQKQTKNKRVLTPLIMNNIYKDFKKQGIYDDKDLQDTNQVRKLLNFLRIKNRGYPGIKFVLMVRYCEENKFDSPYKTEFHEAMAYKY